MLDVKELIGVFLPKFRSLGVKPLLAYYGGSLANGTYEDEKSDIDVVIVADSAPSDVWMGEVRGAKCSLFFNSLDEYLPCAILPNCSISRLYGYLNFAFVKAGDVCVLDNNVDFSLVLSEAKRKGEMAAAELFKRVKGPYMPSKELYHLGNAFNLLFEGTFSLEEIKRAKNGDYGLFVKKLEEKRKEKKI